MYRRVGALVQLRTSADGYVPTAIHAAFAYQLSGTRFKVGLPATLVDTMAAPVYSHVRPYDSRQSGS